jgi:hypothetical protein
MVSLSYSKVGETIRNVIHKITNLLLLKDRRERIFFWRKEKQVKLCLHDKRRRMEKV